MVRILLVDEQKVIREGLKVLLESEADIEIVGAVSNGYAAIGKIEETNPDILFISVKLSEIEGLDVTAIIRNKYPQVKVILFSDKVNEKHLIQALEMGIKGYLLKDTPLKEMVEAIYAVNKGFTHIANTAYEAVIPQIAENLSKLQIEKPDLVLSEIPLNLEASQGKNNPDPENIKSTATQPQANNFSNGEINTVGELQPSETNSEQLFLASANSATATEYSLSPQTEIPPNNRLNRYFSLISLASLGLLAISIGVLSVIFSQRSPEVVIENAIINGKTIPVNSPFKGRLTKVNYVKGASVTEDSIIATIEPLFGERYQPATNQLQEQIELKKQQQIVAQQSLDFLESSLQTLEQELINSSPRQLDTILKSIHLNQIKYQETALKTAKIREDSAKSNYENLQQIYQQKRIEQAQLDSAKNSWDLAKLAIEEISENLANARQEYQLIEEQLAGNKQQENTQVSQKIAGLKQQINSQETSLNLIQTELNNLQNKLIQAIAQATEDRSTAIKSPIAGTIHSQKYQPGEIVESSQPIATIIDCNNLWVEATVDPQITTKINTQEPVLVTIAERNLSLEGKISLIESLNSNQPETEQSSINRAITAQIPPSLTNGNYSRIVVSVPSSVELVNEQQFCSVGQTAQLSFGKEAESLIGQSKSNWLSKILVSKELNK